MPDPDNNYDDSPTPAPAQDGGDDAQSSDDDSQKQSALLPKAIFGGEVKPGDYITLCVDSVQEDEVVCHKEEGHEDEEKEPTPSAPEDEGAPMSGGMQSLLED